MAEQPGVQGLHAPEVRHLNLFRMPRLRAHKATPQDQATIVLAGPETIALLHYPERRGQTEGGPPPVGVSTSHRGISAVPRHARRVLCVARHGTTTARLPETAGSPSLRLLHDVEDHLRLCCVVSHPVATPEVRCGELDFDVRRPGFSTDAEIVPEQQVPCAPSATPLSPALMACPMQRSSSATCGRSRRPCVTHLADSYQRSDATNPRSLTGDSGGPRLPAYGCPRQIRMLP
jgi:hypothetical protein